MAVLTVGSGKQYTTIASAIAASKNGDTIEVQAGTYRNDFATITKDINLVGVGGMVHLVADTTIPNGKAIFVTDANVSIDHFEFSGAAVPDQNGAGIKYETGNLTITYSYFHNNQMGILTGDPTTGTLTIDHSEFAYNGVGTSPHIGHDIYVGDVGKFSLTNSYIHDDNIGHEVKSRAFTTTIADNRILSNSSSDSYEIDLPNGGVANITNNIIQKGPNSQNTTMVIFGEEGSLHPGSSLSISNNLFVNQKSANAVGVNNFTADVAQITGNQFYALTQASVAAGANIQTGDSFLASLPAIDSASHPWSSEASSTVTLESAGSTSLVQVGNNYFLDPVAGGSGPELKFSGSAVNDGQFASSPIAAEQTANGYDVAWKVPGADLYSVWSTDANGNFTSNLLGGVSGSNSSFESLESVFHQDLNGDGFVGVKTAPIPSGPPAPIPPLGAPIESLGSTSLVELGNHYLLNPVAGGSGPELKFSGSAVNDGQFASSPIAAEQTANGYDIAWKVPGADLYSVWSTDANGNFTSNLLGGVSGSNSSFESLESVFHQDLNGDGFVGVKTAPIPSGPPAPIPPSGAPIESLGSTSLVELGNHYLLNPVAGGSGPELKFSGSAVNDGQFASSPIAAEQTANGYDVAWKVPGADLYSVWSTDANGNFTSNLLGGVSGSNSSFESLESVFHQDLNGDGFVGVKTAPIPSGPPAPIPPLGAPIESLGSTSLVELGNHYLLNPVAGGSGPELKFSGGAVNDGQFASSPIAAEQTANGYDVAWKVPGADLYSVWSTDANGNFTSNLLGGVSGSNSSFESLESVFHQDLNGDGFVGVKTAPIPSGAPAPIPSGAPIESIPAPAGSVLSAPQTQQPHNAGDIVGVHLQNNSSQVQASHEVTFGQAFAAGDLPAGATLVALVNGHPIPVQMDVKTVNPDGSVQFAILTIEAPQLAADGSVDVMLARGAAGAPKPAFDISSILHSGYSAELDLTLHNADGSTTPVALNVATLLQHALQSGTANAAWLSGPLSTEVRVEAPITGSLHARFDIRANADGTTSTDVIVLNDGTYIGPTNDYTYDATIKQNGHAVFSQNGLVQYHSSDWHELITSNGTVVTNVQQDVAYLEKTGLVPHYDTTTGVNQSAIAADLTELASADTGPLGNALVQKLMPTVGGRHDIGIMTAWSADYLLTQDADAKAVMLANADAAGSVPWHFTDEATGDPVRVDQHPNVNLYFAAQGSQTWGYGNDSVPGDIRGGGWISDNAHQPDLTNFAYLTTGERYYLDEVQSEGDWGLLHVPPDYRYFASGNLMIHGELRGQAWNLRELADAALATPDSDPMKAYFTQTLQNNLDWMVKTYITDDVLHSAGALEGWLPGYPDEGLIAPWMEDYMAITLSQLAAEGFQGAKEMAAWMVNFEAGRFLNGASGFDTLFGADYYYQVWDPTNPMSSPTLQEMGVTGTPYSSWAEVFQASNLSAEDASYVQGRYDAPDLYPAVARGALASLFDATGSEDALNAYGVVTTAMAKAGALSTYLENPQWDIAPQFSDGSTLHNSDIHIVAGSTGSAFSGVTSDQLIADIGTSSSTLTGGAGINVLLAGTGGDTLVGGANEDHLFGGTGNDRLIGGAGTNYLKGGGGADTFVFSTTDLAHDVVRDFDPARDHIEVHDPSLHVTASALAAAVTTDAHGDAVLHLAAGHDVVLQGIHASSVHTDWFLVSA